LLDLGRSSIQADGQEHEETNNMESNDHSRQTAHRIPVGRVATAAFAAAGLSASVFAIGTAGATVNSVKKVAVSTVKVAKLGTVLSSGKTLYTLKASSNPCTAACMRVWPALVLPKGVTKATAGSGVSASKLGSKSISGGVRQVTYGGKLLYTFSGDSGAKQANGNVTDEWGKWSSVVTKKSSSSGSGSGSGGGGGGGSTSSTGGTAF
jgi:predicted lipoprotein with Yx(FWY)xxD motif